MPAPIRTVTAAAALAVALAASPLSAQTVDSSAGPLQVERIVGGLERPWAVAFLPDGRQLITERPGRLRIVADGAASEPVAGVPEVYASGQGGLFDVAPAADFADTGLLFLSYAEPVDGGAGTAVARARLEGERLEDVEVVFRMNRATSGGRHFGGRIVVAPDGALFVTTGDRGSPERAQDRADHAGKVLRILPDGSVPEDNPFVGDSGAAPEVWSYGHRNVQGAGLDAEGRLWTVEHGARGGDEINRPEAGRNYGWPVISYGVNYDGSTIGEGTEKEGMEPPAFHWDPSIAPSGLTVYDGALFPEWEGDVIVGALKFELVSRVDAEGDALGGETRLLEGELGRVRDVRTGPDGALWLLTDESPGALYRVAPAD